MLQRISARLRPTDPADRDAGLSLVEVIVALLVFTVITTGSIIAVGTVLSMTSDNRSRVVAANLASQAIDKARGAADVFLVTNASTTQQLNGTTFTVKRTASWVTTGGVDSQCATPGQSGNGSLFYKRVNVSVTWTGQRTSTTPVRADTILAPVSKINDPSTGTILISVLDQTGAGSAGVVVTIATASLTGNTASALSADSSPDPTDTDGCSFATKVQPGTYTVTLSRADGTPYRDRDQAADPVQTVVVSAGDTASALFSYAAADTYRPTYATNYSGQALLPTDLTTTYLSSDGRRYVAPTRVTDQYLFPTATGYQVFAGTYAPTGAAGGSCLSPDPASWPATADGKTGKRQAIAVPDPLSSKTAAAPVPMGVVTLNVGNGDRTIRAVSTLGQNGDPGCAIGQTLNFTRTGNGTTATVALPYGTWFIKSGPTTSSLKDVTIGTLIGSLLGVLKPSASTSNTVVVDPRTAP